MLIKSSQSMHTAYELVLCIASTVLSRIAITFYAICCLDHGQREPINQTKGPSRKQQRRRRPTVPRPTLVSTNIGNVWIHSTRPTPRRIGFYLGGGTVLSHPPLTWESRCTDCPRPEGIEGIHGAAARSGIRLHGCRGNIWRW